MKLVSRIALAVVVAATVLGPWATRGRGNGSEAAWLIVLVGAGLVAVGASGGALRDARRRGESVDAPAAVLLLAIAAFVAGLVVFVSVVYADWDP